MKILILNHEFPPVGGGGGSATVQIARELANLKVDVTVMTTAYGTCPRRENKDGYQLIRVPALRRDTLESHPHEIASYLASAFYYGSKFCRKTPPDIVHAFFGVPSGLLAYTFKKIFRLPYVISFRGRDVHGGKALENHGITGWMRTISLPVWRNANRCVANSDGLRDIALHVAPDVAVDVIPNGIDTQQFSPTKIPSQAPVIHLLFVGRLEPYKGLEDLFQALRLLKDKEITAWQLRVVGDGSLRHTLPALANQLGITDMVVFDGPLPRELMPSVYQQADIFVLPSIVEGMSNAILEAMASGLPTVATRIPGSEELVTNEQTGYLVPSQSPTHLAEALQKLVTHRDQRIQMGQTARQEAEQRAWTQVAEAYLHHYQRITKGTVPCVASAAS